MKTTMVLSAALLLSACANLKIQMHASKILNPDINGVYSPVAVRVFELKNNLAFEEGDFDALFNKPHQSLGRSLLKINDYTLFPGQQLRLEQPLIDGVRYIAVAAAFRTLPSIPWKVSVQVYKTNFYINKQFKIHLGENGLSLEEG